MEKLQHECAVVGVFGSDRAAFMCRDMLHKMQHRGPAGTGMVVDQGGTLQVHKQMGLVREAYPEEILDQLSGSIAIGHNRYATCGENNIENLQPWVKKTKDGREIVGASNGDIPRYAYLKERLASQDNLYVQQSGNDGEALVTMVVFYLDQGMSPREAITALMQHPDLEGGAYSCVFIIDSELWAFRDPHGFRPLVLGRPGNAYVVASESCAFNIVGATYVREVFRGEIVQINHDGERSYPGVKSTKKALCDFELIYFGRPDSRIFGVSVSDTRKLLGRKLWELHRSHFTAPADEYVVISVPDSSNSIALGFSHAAGFAFDFGLIRSHYAGRGFLQPNQNAREEAAKEKYSVDPMVVRGKRVIVVDDSLVRGTTMRKLVRMLRLAGATEVNVMIGSPPVTHPCFYGIDTPTKSELAASHSTPEEIQHQIEVDFLGYLTVAALHSCLPKRGEDFCSACFTGDYPCQDKIPPEKFVA